MSKSSKFRFAWVLTLLAGVALVVASCGGGGGGGGAPVVTLTDTAGNPTSRIVPNSSAVTSLSGLKPYTQYDITVLDGTGTEVSYLRLTSDGNGEIPETVLAYNLVAGNYTFDVEEIARTRQGDSYVDSRQATTSGSFTVAAAAGDRILEIVDQTNQLRTSFNVGEGVYVRGSGFAASSEVDVYLCLDQALWDTGDPLNDVSGEIENTPNPFPEEDVKSGSTALTTSRALSGDAERVTTDAQGNIAQTVVWPSAGGAGLAFDVVVDVNKSGTFDQGDAVMDQATVGFMVQQAARQVAGDFIANISVGANAARKDVFAVDEDVFGLINPPTRMQLGSDRYVKKYVVAHKGTWNQGDALADVSGLNSPWEADTVQSGCTNEGRVLLWPAQLTAGEYDVIIDVNRNDVYDLGVDILDGGPVVGFTVGQPPAQKKWTFLVYADGDNNLEQFAIADINEAEQAGSNNDINIVFQMDRIPGFDSTNGDWTGTRRYYVTQEATAAIASTLVQDLGEVNMADPNTLRDFVNWGIAAYPANHYALVLWNHGSGVRTRGPQEVTRDVCWDDTDGGSLSIAEVRGALGLIGANLDVLGYDACLMAMTEAAYEMRSMAAYSIFSQDLEPGAGWPYDTILNALRANPNMTAAQLAAQVVTAYAASYPGGTAITQSAAESAQLAALANSVDQFAQAMIDDIDANRTSLQIMAGQARRFAGGRPYPDYRDLYHFAEMVNTNIVDAEIQAAAQAVMNGVNSAVGGRETHSAELSNAHGLSIWLPDRQYLTNNIRKYSECLFAHDTRWDDFLAYLWGTVIRVELTWGQDPSDLDSHLWDAQEPPNHVAYYNMSIPGADLDLDDVTSFGPENVTITALIAGPRGQYDYAVHHYSGTLPPSAPAVVRVFRGGATVPAATFSTGARNFPTNGYWHVFSINPADAAITAIDTMSASAPVALARGESAPRKR